MLSPKPTILKKVPSLKTIPNMPNRTAQAKALQSVVKKPQLSQRDTYAKAMNAAQKNGGSNGVGVGM